MWDKWQHPDCMPKNGEYIQIEFLCACARVPRRAEGFVLLVSRYGFDLAPLPLCGHPFIRRWRRPKGLPESKTRKKEQAA